MIAVLGVLSALAVNGLRIARTAGRQSAAEATMAQHLAIMGLYIADFRDSHPWFGRGENGVISLSSPNTGNPFTFYYFETCSAWPLPMAAYYGDTWPHKSQTYPRPELGMSGYLYSCAMIADPAFWSERTRTGPSQWRSTRAPEVRYPSRKALLTAATDRQPFPDWVTDGLTMGCCDGSVRFIPKPRLRLPIVSGDSPDPGVYHIRGYYGLDTVDGVHGVDID